MIEKDLVIVGGGPAGLSAAIVASSLGAAPLLIDDNPVLGGQLIKQTHKFFGSGDLYCGIRGIDIAALLREQVMAGRSEVMLNASVVGYFPDRVLGVSLPDSFIKVRARQVIFATGASENIITFPGCDLPGVMGAGAIQTMMNVYGVRPGRRVLMVGAGNIGLIVSYQLLQAGIDVACVVEIMPEIGGYHVHAAKLARLGVPILTSHTIVEAIGRQEVTGAVIARVDRNRSIIPRTRRRLRVDTICLAVGLTPLSELLVLAGCQVVYVPELGGHVAWHDENLETSVPGLFVAGDLAGIEEASTAMLEGRLAGAVAAERLRGITDESERIKQDARRQLAEIRQGPFGQKVRVGLQFLQASQRPGNV